jgi:hypothetical protein
MPTVLRSGPYRFFFYSGDRNEPVHIHVERDDCTAKYWLEPIRLQTSGGFGRGELNQIYNLIVEHHLLLLRSWNDFFGL